MKSFLPNMGLHILTWNKWNSFNRKHGLFVLFFTSFSDPENYNYCVYLTGEAYKYGFITFAKMEWSGARNVCVLLSLRSFSQVLIIEHKKVLWIGNYPTIEDIMRGFRHLEETHFQLSIF